jgi:molybdopterin-containing oxidoreductase family iron-sulfur binding subunit
MSDGVNRRDFLKLLGLGAASVTAGCAPGGKPEKLIPYLIPPEDVIPGVAQYYASTCTDCPAGCGLLVRTREGRATKLEGNPDHPVNRGKLCARGHSALQALYNPDRLAGPQLRTGANAWKSISWNEAIALVASKLRAARGRANGVAVLTGHTTGSLDALLADWVTAMGSTRRVSYEPLGHEALRAANKMVFGVDGIPTYDLAAAKFILSFGADFLDTWISPTEYARGFRAQHSAQGGVLGTYVHVEPRLSLTGANADEWVAVKPGTEGALALGLVSVIAQEGLGAGGGALGAVTQRFTPQAVSEMTGVAPERIQRLARAFASAKPSLALAGGTATASSEGTATAAAVNLLNHVAGNVGRTVNFGRLHSLSALGTYQDVLDLVRAMNAGEVQTLVVHDTNPAHTLPAASGFAQAMAKVPFSVAFTPVMTETASLASLVLPIHHPLETWGDAEPADGVYSLLQPVMQPVATLAADGVTAVPRFNTMPVGDALLAIARATDATFAVKFPAPTFQDYIKTRWQAIHTSHGGGQSFEDFWNATLQRGGVFAESTPGGAASLATGATSFTVNLPTFENAGAPYALLPYPHSYLYDGRGANRPWLQELPDPVTKAVWGTWVEMNPKTAEKLGVAFGDKVDIETAHGRINAPVYPYPGIREDVIAVPLGQGHTAYGRYANGRGSNVAAILPSMVDARSGGLAWMSTRATVSRAGGPDDLVVTGNDGRQHGIAIAEVLPLATLAAHGEAESLPANVPTPGTNAAHQADELGVPPRKMPTPASALPPEALEAPGAPRRHRWGMAIDLSSCIGCGACSAACYAENNIAIVGKDRVTRGREMAWIRIERYWEGDGEALETRFVPMLCQHCDDAPCEPVCPVFATYHNPEGLNVQVYNRCVGTRYCSNNCPYRVRTFNYFDYDFPEPLNLQLNPDVTVRSKGIMEKCTFCTQRIREAKDKAQDERRGLRDGEIVPACAQTCPTDAIVFGDLNDPASRVTQLARRTRGYRVLDDLNTKPAITYLKKVTRRQIGSLRET